MAYIVVFFGTSISYRLFVTGKQIKREIYDNKLLRIYKKAHGSRILSVTLGCFPDFLEFETGH